jgi:NAD(P)-dependent dehydrogenase (short-subunit alcohol dehydrogenase family)
MHGAVQQSNIFENAIEHFEKIDIVISNAGIESWAHVGEVTLEQFDQA